VLFIHFSACFRYISNYYLVNTQEEMDTDKYFVNNFALLMLQKVRIVALQCLLKMCVYPTQLLLPYKQQVSIHCRCVAAHKIFINLLAV
jgi:hypothetical protein